MKTNNKWLAGALVLSLLGSCTDDHVLDFEVTKPASIAEMEYLNQYDALKQYIDRSDNPNFKLGAGVTVSEYLKKDGYAHFINENFDGMTAGNAMKHSSVVGDNGAMNFGPVVQFVDAAKEAGLEIYGHTLVWHSQQNKKFLEGLMADKEMEVDPDAAESVLMATTAAANANVWDYQLNYVLPEPLIQGVEYTLKLRAKASEAYTVAFWRFDGTSTDYGPDFAVGEDWGDVAISFTPSMNATTLQFCFGTFGGKLYFDDLVLTAAGSEDNLVANGSFEEDALSGWEKPSWHDYSFGIEQVAGGPAVWYTERVTNGDVEGDDLSSFFATEAGDGPKAATIGAAGTGADGVGRAIVVQSGDNPAEEWDTQFFVTVSEPFMEGDKFRFSMKYKAAKEAGSTSQAHYEPGEYQHYEFVGQPQFTTEWKTLEYAGTISLAQAGGEDNPRGAKSIAFNLAVLGEANTYYFDDISWAIEESGNKIPLTPEEKADTLTWAMETWIAGMMEATDTYVTEWDVVNEAISGADSDGDGIYDLWSASNVSEQDALNNFYWGDYLGENYVRQAVAFARQYGPENVKLFINDYNLESDWDDNQKLRSLIKWIEKWEEDGVTVIDGIGTQMHVSCYMNPETQAKKEEHVVKMLELMAATGKLVKITELDMGLVDAEGEPVKTGDVTLEQHKAMSAYYKFILQKYFEIIPAEQRYGITHWCPLDSPESSSWRGGEPVGLWSLDKYRKHTYAGFADGLSGE